MNTYELTLYLQDGGVEVVECTRMDLLEAWDFFRNYLYGRPVIHLKVETKN